jgi:hypothetical protein
MDRQTLTKHLSQTLTGLALAPSLTLPALPTQAQPMKALGQETLASYISWPSPLQTFYLAGALEMLFASGIACRDTITVGMIGDSLKGRYHAGRLKPSDPTATAMWALLLEYGCEAPPSKGVSS